MPRGYHHLTQDERCQIWGLKKSGLSQRDIGRELGRHHTTIRREMQRNSGGRGYRYKQAHNKATERRHRASSVPRKMTPALWQLVEEKLAAGWSPEQISGRLLLEGQVMVGRMRIYEYVRTDRKAGGSLYKLLRRRGKKPNWRGGRHAGRGRIPGRVDISERPAIVEQKSRIGDWEADTIVGAGQSGAVASVVDRASKMTRLARVDRKTAEEVGAALIRRLEGDRHLVHTITADNGKEFADHSSLSKALDAKFYFARPYHSWERGLNEHTNGLVRQYLPKGTDFRSVTDAEVQAVEDLLNSRPRKALGFRTPEEVFRDAQAPP